jgi:hypothetical protein
MDVRAAQSSIFPQGRRGVQPEERGGHVQHIDCTISFVHDVSVALSYTAISPLCLYQRGLTLLDGIEVPVLSDTFNQVYRDSANTADTT